ncbi:MAG: hypothetical protein DHS20C16_19510 [Phycisphaerae bacterium]|nr:MAG: hypothetical protein DHS20C16_19510 [Phycisphaerae bacterium]
MLLFESDMIHASIIIPTFREAGNLEQLVDRIAQSLVDFNGAYEVLIVDDNSQDGTEPLVEKLRDTGHPVRVIVRRDERGLSSAVIRGLDEAQGEVLVCMDADLSHPPEMIPRLLSALQKPGVEFVIGSRYVDGAGTDADWGLFRRLNSIFATLLARPFTAARDPMSGFFAIRRDRYQNHDELSPLGYKIGLELIVKCNCRNVLEVPIHFAQRRCGSSKLNFKQQLLYLRHIWRLACYKLTKRR